ncbi:hypothetical protein [Phenylobacterium sp.]|uniref:hypothetical protein n=1 Tax=Phenylobacterium sp. TaxID=1871053 RepID=UPI002FE3E2F5
MQKLAQALFKGGPRDLRGLADLAVDKRPIAIVPRVGLAQLHRMTKPIPSQTETLFIEVDGANHQGTFHTAGKMVYVQYKGFEKVTQIGGSTPRSIARMLLRELVLARAGKPSEL